VGGCGAVKIESVQGPPTFLRRPLGHSVIREDMTLEVPSIPAYPQGWLVTNRYELLIDLLDGWLVTN